MHSSLLLTAISLTLSTALALPQPEPQGAWPSSSSPSAATVAAVSQISDGQPQAPAASTWSSAPYSNAFTIYTSMTNSLGVITGMPAVVTSQPAVVTSQPVSPTLPHYSGYAYGNETTSSASAPSTMASATGGSSEGASTSATASATIAQGTGGAAANRVAGCGVALVVLGAVFSLL